MWKMIIFSSEIEFGMMGKYKSRFCGDLSIALH